MMVRKSKTERAKRSSPVPTTKSELQQTSSTNGEVHVANTPPQQQQQQEVMLREKTLSSSSATPHSIGRRSMTFKSMFRRSATIHVSGDSEQEPHQTTKKKRRSTTNSVFYVSDEYGAVTKSVCEPAEFELLHLENKDMDELLQLLQEVRLLAVFRVTDTNAVIFHPQEFDGLGRILNAMTTGSSKMDMMVYMPNVELHTCTL